MKGFTQISSVTQGTWTTPVTVVALAAPIALVTPAAPVTVVALAAPIAMLTRVTKQPGVQQAQTRVAQPGRRNYRKPV